MGLFSTIGQLGGALFGGSVGAVLGRTLGSLLDSQLADKAHANMLLDSIGTGTNQAAQQLTQQDGMPAFLKDDIQTIVKEALSSLRHNDVDTDVQQAFDEAHAEPFRKLSDELSQSLVQTVRDQMHSNLVDAQEKAGPDSSAVIQGEGSWLQAIAQAMGKVMGSKASRMVELSNQISELAGKQQAMTASPLNTSEGLSKPTQNSDIAAQVANAQKSQQLNTEFQAIGQEFNLLQTTFTTAIKTIGEGMASVARKQ